MQQLRICGVILALFIMISACGKDISVQERAFSKIIPAHLDTGLNLKLLEVRDASSMSPTITLLIENRSNDQVWFLAPKYGSRLFVYSESDEKWIEIENRIISVTESGDILVPKGQGMNWVAVVSVVPTISDTDKTVTVRVVVVGEVYRDGQRTGEKVGAYTDVTLQP